VAAAAAHARSEGARIWALHVLEDPERPPGAEPPPTWGAADLLKLTTRAEDRLAAGLEASGASGELRVVPGEPATEILEHAAEIDADFIVLGTTGQTGLKLSRLGTVAEAVVRRAQCTVLVVRLLEG